MKVLKKTWGILLIVLFFWVLLVWQLEFRLILNTENAKDIRKIDEDNKVVSVTASRKFSNVNARLEEELRKLSSISTLGKFDIAQIHYNIFYQSDERRVINWGVSSLELDPRIVEYDCDTDNDAIFSKNELLVKNMTISQLTEDGFPDFKCHITPTIFSSNTAQTMQEAGMKLDLNGNIYIVGKLTLWSLLLKTPIIALLLSVGLLKFLQEMINIYNLGIRKYIRNDGNRNDFR